MANAILTADFLTPTAVTATTTATKYRVADVLLDTKPFRVHRGTSASGQSLVFDFATDVTVIGAYVDHVNWTTGDWTAGATNTGTGDTLGTRTQALEELTQRYKGLHVLAMTTPRRYVAVAISGVLGGASYAETGAVTFVTSAGMTPIGYSFGFPDYGQAQDVEQLTVSSQVAARGRQFARLGLGQPNLLRGSSDAGLANFRNLIARAKVTPHLYSENRELDGNGTCRHAWLGLIDGGEQRHGLTKRTFSPETLTFREVIE